MGRAIVPIGIGALTFGALHFGLVETWQTWFQGGDGFAPWFMNSGRTVICALISFAVVSFGVSILDRRSGVDVRLLSAAYVVAGAMIPMIAVLFTMRGGPGNLFPITIVIGALVIFVGAAIGVCLGWVVRLVGVFILDRM